MRFHLINRRFRMFREFFEKEKIFKGLTNPTGYKTITQNLLLYTIIFLAIYGLVYGYFVNNKNSDWALRDMVKFPATFLLALLFSSPAYHLLMMIFGCKLGYKETLAIMLAGMFVMSTFTLVFGGILLLLMGINNASYSIMQLTNGLVIFLGCLIGSVYFYFGLRVTHQFSDGAAIALTLICGIIFIVMLPQAAGLIGSYSSGTYGGYGLLEGMSGMWKGAQMTSALVH